MANPVFDAVLPLMRNKYTWIPFYVFIASFVFFNFKKNKYYFFGAVLLTIAISDQTSSNLIKNQFERLRPCNVVELEHKMIERIPCKNGYSFTSSHATNHFAIASFLLFTLGSYLKIFRWPILVWAGVISFAQVYVGVHYPLDIICGALLGFLIGWLNFKLYSNLSKRQVA